MQNLSKAFSKLRMHRYFGRILLVSGCVFSIVGATLIFFSGNYVTINLANIEKDDLILVFYDTGKGFNDKQYLMKKVSSHAQGQLLSFKLPNTELRGIRLDLATQDNVVRLRKISFNSFDILPRQVFAVFNDVFGVEKFQAETDDVAISLVTTDPRMVAMTKRFEGREIPGGTIPPTAFHGREAFLLPVGLLGFGILLLFSFLLSMGDGIRDELKRFSIPVAWVLVALLIFYFVRLN
jgi:hypothetical protein